MFWLIEDDERLDILSRMKLKSAYVEIIPYSPTIHPVENNVSCVYIKPLDGSKGYMVTIKHSEAFSVEKSKVQELIESIEHIYVIDKKEFLHYFYHPSISSLILIYPKFTKKYTSAHNFLYNREEKNINLAIPISKHYEMCQANFNELQPYLTQEINPFYNDKATLVFANIESVGIKVNSSLYKERFGKDTRGYAYTQYNLSTTTTRPSNSFDGINFAALNKENGERECFIPRNDVFVEMDISAYHPTLLALVLGYDWGTDDIHQAFADLYRVDYSQAKEITFKQLYGGIWKEYEHLEFFQKVKQFTEKLWNDFNENGYIECPISKHRYEKDKLENMNPQKLLNYFLQNLETANNVRILGKILKVLKHKNTKLVLYVYDSFLFDVDKTEKEILYQILDIFKENKLNVKLKKGTTYTLK